jgi:hypothetical protein
MICKYSVNRLFFTEKLKAYSKFIFSFKSSSMYFSFFKICTQSKFKEFVFSFHVGRVKTCFL